MIGSASPRKAVLHLAIPQNKLSLYDRQRRWSDPTSWPSGRLPAEGEEVTVSSRWRMLLDITPPTLGKVYIYGELMFEDQRDYNFTADLVRTLRYKKLMTNDS